MARRPLYRQQRWLADHCTDNRDGWQVIVVDNRVAEMPLSRLFNGRAADIALMPLYNRQPKMAFRSQQFYQIDDFQTRVNRSLHRQLGGRYGLQGT